MRPDHALARLQHHQDQIIRLLGEVRPLLQQGDASQHKALGLARWQLLRLLREYQLFKHTEIFDPIIGTGDDRRAASAALLKQGCIAIAAAFNEHVQRCRSSDWPDPGRATGPKRSSWPTGSTDTCCAS